MEWLFLVLSVLVLLFGSALFFGAPYLPTMKPQIEDALDLLNLKKGDVLLEIGSGDGRVLLAAAQRGLQGVGYEINPLLVWISRWRLRKYRGKVKIIWGDGLRAAWPPAQGMYVFGITKIMSRLHTKIVQYAHSLTVVSFGFPLANKKPTRQKDALFLYKY